MRCWMIFFMLFPTFAHGWGDTGLEGKLKNGDKYYLQADCMFDDAECKNIQNHYTIFIKKVSGLEVKINTACAFNYEMNKFSCVVDKNSPFSGTIYSGKPFHGSCEKGDPELVFTCKKNCARVPKIMTHSYWEC